MEFTMKYQKYIYIIISILLSSCLWDTGEVESTWDSLAFIPEEVIEYMPDGETGFTDTSKALGYPNGGGDGSASTDVVSLGDDGEGRGGFIILKFGCTVYDGEGIDFKIFENPFSTSNGNFIEAAFIELSLDGKIWFEYPNEVDNDYGIWDPLHYIGFAGIEIVYSSSLDFDSPLPESDRSGGDIFDLSGMSSPIKENGFKYIKITDAGNEIEDPGNGFGNNGFDLDSVIAIYCE